MTQGIFSQISPVGILCFGTGPVSSLSPRFSHQTERAPNALGRACPPAEGTAEGNVNRAAEVRGCVCVGLRQTLKRRQMLTR